MSIHNPIYRYLALVLTLLLAAGLMISCGGETPAQTTTATDTTQAVTTAQTEPPIEYFKLTSQAHVIRPEGELSEDMATAVKILTSAGKALVEGGMPLMGAVKQVAKAHNAYTQFFHRNVLLVLLRFTSSD